MQSINTLMSAFGVAPPDLSKLNKTVGKIKNDFEKEKFRNKGVSRLYVSPANRKKMTDAIRMMIDKGIEDRQKIYDQLIVLCVLPSAGNKYMSSATVWRHIQNERKKLGWERNTKAKQILDSFDSGVSKKEIQAMYPGPKNRGQRNYIHDCLIKYGRIKKQHDKQ